MESLPPAATKAQISTFHLGDIRMTMNKVMATKAKTAKAAVKKLPKEVSVEAAAEAKLLAENGNHSQGGFSTNVADSSSDGGNGGSGGISPVVILGGLAAAGGIAAAAAGGGSKEVVVQPVPVPAAPAPAPAPTYALTAGATSVDEGGVAIFTLKTTNLAANSTVAYEITGVSASDLVNGKLTGTAVVGADGVAKIEIPIAADQLTEGAETLKVTAGGASATIVVNDTSITSKTVALSKDVDAAVGSAGNDTFNANDVTYSLSGTDTVVNSLGASDSIDGDVGNDTLNITSALAVAIPATALVKNVETANVSTQSTVTGDFSGWTGLTALNVTASKGASTITAAATTAVSLTNTTAGLVTIAGGSTQTVVTKGGVTLSGAAGAINVTDTAQGTQATTINGGTLVDLKTTTTGTATITIGGTAAPTGTVNVTQTVNGTGATAGGAIAVTGGTNVAIVANATQATNGTDTTLGAITVTGKSTTTSVSVTQQAAVTNAATVAAVTESNVATFTALNAGQSLTIGGLTFVAGSAGTTIAETAAAFANLAAGATSGASTKGTYSGALTGWSTGVATATTVTFTSSTAGKNVTDLTVATLGGLTANTGATLVKTDGVAAAGVGGIVNGAVTINDAITANTSTSAGSITTVTAANYTTLTVDANNVSTMALTGGSGNVTIDNTSARTTATTTLNLTLDGVTGGTLDDADVYTTLNITTANNASTLANITDTALTTLTIGGTKGITFTSTAGMTALKTVTVSGSAGVKGTFALVAGGSFDASATSGANTVTINATVATYTGGTGADVVTTAAANPTKAISLGAGDDTLVLAAGTTTLGAAIDGGAGTADTLTMVAADVATAAASSAFVQKVTGFEILKVTTGTGAETIDVGSLGIANTVDVAAGAGVTLNGFAATGGTLKVSGAQTGTITIANAAWTAGTADAVTISISNAAAGTINTSNVETVNISSSVATTLALVDAAAKSVVLTGSGVTLTTAGAVALTSVDGSALTGALTYTATSTAAATVKGGAGDDVLSAHASNSTVADTLIGGAGNDTLNSNAGLTTLTGGEGADIFAFAANSAGAASNIYSTITDFSKGDMIQFANLGTETFAATKITLAATATFADYLNQAAAGDGSANAAISWFQFNGDTYVVNDRSAGATFTASADIVVKVSGLQDLSSSLLVGANGNQLVFG